MFLIFLRLFYTNQKVKISDMIRDEDNVMGLLKGVIDPELMINIVDLGLVYNVDFNEDNKQIDVAITLTSPGCPLGDVIMEDAYSTIEDGYPEYKINIEIVWDPPWSTEMISEEGREELGFM